MCSPCFLVCPEYGSMSSLFTGVPESFLVYTECCGVFALFSGVSRVFSGVSKISRCECFLVCPELSRCTRLVFLCL